MIFATSCSSTLLVLRFKNRDIVEIPTPAISARSFWVIPPRNCIYLRTIPRKFSKKSGVKRIISAPLSFLFGLQLNFLMQFLSLTQSLKCHSIAVRNHHPLVGGAYGHSTY